jgi:large subunit ribosomal protein L4
VKLNIRNKEGNESGQIDVRDDVFAVPQNLDLVHQVMVGHLANKRQGTAKTKNRSEVSGGGAKPRPQKHTGSSRQGSTRSPIWVGGGRAFGPSPRSYRKSTPKKMRRLAMLSVLSDKVRRGSLVVLDNLDIADARTKSVKTVLDSLGMEKSTLIVTNGSNQNVIRSSRNLDKVKTLPVKVINTLDLMNNFNVVITEEAVRQVEAIWGGVYKGETYAASESTVVEEAESAVDTVQEDLIDQNRVSESNSLDDEQLLGLIVSQIEASRSQGDNS